MATTPKKPRAKPAPVKPAPGPANPLSPRRVELTRRLHALARDPAKIAEFESVRVELDALPPDA